MINWFSVELHADLGQVLKEHYVVLSGRSQVKLKGSKVGFALSFFQVLLELDTQSETQEIWMSCKLRVKGRFLEANLHVENAELTVLIGASVCFAQPSE